MLYNIMLHFKKIIEEVKRIENLNFDSEVADLLGIQADKFRMRKSRNSIPYEELATYCNIKNINFNWLMTGEGAVYIQETEKEMEIKRLQKENSNLKDNYYQITKEDRTAILGVAEKLEKQS
mgnify:CR=1 FL=1